jgi:hypothetical protein
MAKRGEKPNSPVEDERYCVVLPVSWSGAPNDEQLLAQVVSRLVDDEASPEDVKDALLTLLGRGPFLAQEPALRWSRGSRPTTDEIAALRSLLVPILRSLVTARNQFRYTLQFETGPLRFAGFVMGRTTQCLVDGHLGDVLVLQLLALLIRARFPEVRVCSAPDCERLYVKLFRREFCSVRCQSRTYMRTRRENARRQRRRRTRGGVPQ